MDKLRNEDGLDSLSFRSSRVSLLNQVMDALGDPDLYMIGVYGIGGIGKTTLAKEVHRKASDDRLFDSVVMVAVSQPPELGRIQSTIADSLGLEFEFETVYSRASQLYEMLKDSYTLIILDGLCSKLDLMSAGIPFGQGCKILLTSRSLAVLRTEMRTQREFSIEGLPEEEAWSLFKSKVANAIDPDLQPLATEVAKKCAGLPLLLLRVAADLRNKELSAWNGMLNKLSLFENEGVYRKVRSVLQSSYHNLPRQEVKSIFLLCALYGRSNILINDLIRYSMGLGLFKDIIGIEGVRNSVYSVIDKLKDECLLLDGDMEGFVKMHDMVRDNALRIASRVENAFIGGSGDTLSEWPGKDCTKISLPLCDIDYLPTGLEFPEVELFLMLTEDYSLRVSDSFFEGIRKLKVVEFTSVYFGSLPSSLGLLTNLRTLCLEGCHLDDLVKIGELKQLECLSLARSYIAELPREIEQLTQLKLLDLSNCSKIENFPSNVLSKLSLLEELYMGNSFVEWDVKGNASLRELKELPGLTTLEIQVIDSSKIPSGLFSKGLQRYRIFIGDQWKWGEKYETSRTLKLKLDTRIYLKCGLKDLLRWAETLCLCEVRVGWENGWYDLDGEGCRHLKHLHIQNDDVSRFIIDSTKRILCHAFPLLETLFLFNLKSLEKICHGQPAMGSFKKLLILQIIGCNKLKNLFSLSLAKYCLPQLQEMELKDCAVLESIIAEGSEDGDYNNEEMEFTQFRSLSIRNLPCLRSISIPKEVSLEKTAHRQDTSEVTLFNETVSFPNLTSLDVFGCKSLKYICKISTVKCLLQLKTLMIEDCEFVKEIILSEKFEEGGGGGEGEEKEKSITGIVFPNLDFIHLHKLPNFIRFSNGYPIAFQRLRKLKLSCCCALKNFVGKISNVGMTNDENQPLFNEMVTFSNLQKIDILGMHTVEYIWHSQLQADSFSKLQSISILGMQSLKQIWSVDTDKLFTLPNLKSVCASFCEALEYVFPASTSCSLLQLEKLQISHCGVEHIIGRGKSEEEPYSFHFPQLTLLELKGLDKLRSFYELKHLQIRGCHPEKTTSYQEPNIADCHVIPTPRFPVLMDKRNLEESPALENFASSNNNSGDILCLFNETVTFSNLQRVEISGMNNLEYIWHNQLAFFICKLESLSISHCSKLSVVFSMNGSVRFQKLKKLQISSMPSLKRIWSEDADELFSFQNLKSVEVFNCDVLEYVFPASVACGLLHLESLQLGKCRAMEHIVGKGKSDKEFFSFNFPQLTRFGFEHLDKLKSVYEGTHTSNWPKLKFLDVCGYHKALLSSHQDPYIEVLHSLQIPQPHLSLGKVSPSLQTLIECFSELKAIELCKFTDGDNGFPFCFLERFKCLENLVIIESSLEELFLLDEERAVGDDGRTVRHVSAIVPLSRLELRLLPNLKHIWKEISHKVPFKLYLHFLKVYDCGSLMSIAPSSVSFQYLTYLYVTKCNKLENLVTTSTAKTMVYLKEMQIEDCDIIKEIVAKDGDRAKPQITFNQLENLELRNLPKLNSFCSGVCTFNFPLLEKVTVMECLQMKTFCGGVLNTRKLRKITSQYREFEHWEGNLNDTIASLYKESVGRQSLSDMFKHASSSKRYKCRAQFNPKSWIVRR